MSAEKFFDVREPLSGESEAMAGALESRHGVHAAAVAEFFSDYHGQNGNLRRSWAWARVADKVRHRQRARLSRARS